MDTTRTSGSATTGRRQRQIEDCLFDNLQHRPYSSVSISDLCHQLGLSRKSFYNYYPDKDSCFRAIISRRLQECILHLASVPSFADSGYIITAFLSFCREQKSLFDVIVRNNLLTFLMDQTIHYLRDEDRSLLELLDTPQLKDDPYVLSCFVSVNITFVLQWYMQNFDIPLEEMVSKYQRLLYEPLICKKPED